MHDTDIDKDLRDMINAAMSAAGTPEDVRERVIEREEARVRENLEMAASWEDLDDQQIEDHRFPLLHDLDSDADTLALAVQDTQQAVTDVHFEALVLGQFRAMETLWRAAPVPFHSAAVQTEFALNLEHLVANFEDQASTST